MSENNLRKVTFRYDNAKGFEHRITFINNPEPFAGSNGVIEHVRPSDPDLADKLEQLLKVLEANQTRFFDWLEESPENTRLFIEDPLKALEAASVAVSN